MPHFWIKNSKPWYFFDMTVQTIYWLKCSSSAERLVWAVWLLTNTFCAFTIILSCHFLSPFWVFLSSWVSFTCCSKLAQRLKLRQMGWLSSLKDRHWCATLIQLGRDFKSYRKWLVQWVFVDQLDVPTCGDVADVSRGGWLFIHRRWWYNLPGLPPPLIPLLTPSLCVLSRGVFVLGFQILTRHRWVPWKSSWHTVRRVVLSPGTQVKDTKLENIIRRTHRAFPNDLRVIVKTREQTLDFRTDSRSWGSTALLSRVTSLYISVFYILSDVPTQKHLKKMPFQSILHVK